MALSMKVFRLFCLSIFYKSIFLLQIKEKREKRGEKGKRNERREERREKKLL